MKIAWDFQNLHANRTIHEFPLVTKGMTRRIQLHTSRHFAQYAIPLQNGDLLMLCCHTVRQAEFWYYPFRCEFREKQLLDCTGVTANVAFAWSLFESDFATIDNYENETFQTLRVHSASRDSTYDRSLTFDDEKIYFLEALYLTSSCTTMILGNKYGTIFLVTFPAKCWNWRLHSDYVAPRSFAT